MLFVHPKHRLTVWEWFTKAGKGLDSSQLLDKRSTNGRVDHLPHTILYMSNDFIARWQKYISSQWQNVTSGSLIFADSITVWKIEIAIGFHNKILFHGKYAIPSGTTPYSDVKLMHVLYKGVIQETTHCKGEYVSSVFICPKKDSI